MTKTKKQYYSLDELTGAWGLSDADVRYAAQNDMLRLAVHMDGCFFTYSFDADGEPVHPGLWLVDGPIDLGKWNVMALFRDGEVRLREIPAEDDRAVILEGRQAITVRQHDLVVREEERLRFEAEELPKLRVASSAPSYALDGLLGSRGAPTPMQRKLLELLLDAESKGDPWKYGTALLDAAGSKSDGLGDLFRRRSDLWELIKGDDRGYYRLIPAHQRPRAAA